MFNIQNKKSDRILILEISNNFQSVSFIVDNEKYIIITIDIFLNIR